MSGIASTGLISGIDSASLIDQLIATRTGPLTSASRRRGELITTQRSFSGIDSLLDNLRTAAASFRSDRTFDSKRATVSDESVLTATVSPGAPVGSFRFVVDRLVSTQQQLSRGFTDRSTSPFGATSITLEGARARLDRDTDLSELNGGDGVARGRILVTGASGGPVEVDLSRVATASEVVEAINRAGIAGVTARTQGGRFVLDGATAVSSVAGFTTAQSLGLAGPGATVGPGGITGASVFGISGETLLETLNDGNGVDIADTVGLTRFDFTITVNDGAQDIDVDVNLGPVFEQVTNEDGEEVLEATVPAALTVGQALERINTALEAAGVDTRAAVNAEGVGLALVTGATETVTVSERGGAQPPSATARDLGLIGVTGGNGATLSGTRVLAGLGTVLLKNLGGGGRASGLPGAAELTITLRDGTELEINLSGLSTLEEAIGAIRDASDLEAGGALEVGLNAQGTGLELIDNSTPSGSSNLTVSSTDDGAAAAALGILTPSLGVEGNRVGGNAQLRYLSEGTLLSGFNEGSGVGQGTFRVTDGQGRVASITINESTRTLGDLIRLIDGATGETGALGISARINDTGDGILIEGTEGSLPIEIEDVTGTVADLVGIAGSSASGQAGLNRIDGSFETTIEFEATDTLDDAVEKINEARAGVSVSVLNDGSGLRPFRLSFSSTQTGRAGRVLITPEGLDLGLVELETGEDARVFLGGGDPASGLLLTSTNSTLDGVIPGVTLDLASAGDDPVTVNITTDTAAIESAVNALLESYNEVVDRIEFETRFDQDTGERGTLLGDGTVLALRAELANAVLGSNQGFSGAFNTLASVGVTFGEGGRLQLNTTRFRDALNSDPISVSELFTRQSGSSPEDETFLDENGNVIATIRAVDTTINFNVLGVVPQLERVAARYGLSGILSRVDDSLTNQIEAQNQRIADITDSLDRERQRLEAEFVALEQALARLQGQQSALGSLGGPAFGG